MSGSLSVGPPSALVSHTSVPRHLPLPLAQGPGPDGTASQSLMAGSPAPALAAAPSCDIDQAGLTRMAELAPAARGLPVAPGPQAAGRTLAAADISMAAWPAPTSGALSAGAASALQVGAIRPQAHAGFAAAQRLPPAFP